MTLDQRIAQMPTRKPTLKITKRPGSFRRGCINRMTGMMPGRIVYRLGVFAGGQW